MSHKLTEAN